MIIFSVSCGYPTLDMDSSIRNFRVGYFLSELMSHGIWKWYFGTDNRRWYIIKILTKVGSTWILCSAQNIKMLNRFGFLIYHIRYFTSSYDRIFQLEFCRFQISFSTHLYIVGRQRWPSAKLICLRCGKKKRNEKRVQHML